MKASELKDVFVTMLSMPSKEANELSVAMFSCIKEEQTPLIALKAALLLVSFIIKEFVIKAGGPKDVAIAAITERIEEYVTILTNKGEDNGTQTEN